ncbi:hypothetical protein [Clavibacter capsici]|uniref:hypothetical protein n=1 Tax=Clavibacter capsici TaxID=1874630 RepID=UPI0006B153F1|nr:hypothetical protein [Clavibacter capsici]ALD13134.1 hypothetical protein AES38_09570 [Clavibacter capsici]
MTDPTPPPNSDEFTGQLRQLRPHFDGIRTLQRGYAMHVEDVARALRAEPSEEFGAEWLAMTQSTDPDTRQIVADVRARPVWIDKHEGSDRG